MISIGKKGFIVNEGVPNPYIMVEDDHINTGGYLIFKSPTSDFAYAYDDWVLLEDLEQYFQEAKWEIDWSDN